MEAPSGLLAIAEFRTETILWQIADITANGLLSHGITNMTERHETTDRESSDLK